MKKKGFTLVELLAVIVILAVILVIAVPKITDVIENAKVTSAARSAELYVSGIKNAMLKYQLEHDGATTSNISDLNITMNGQSVEIVTIDLNSDGDVVKAKFKSDKYICSYSINSNTTCVEKSIAQVEKIFSLGGHGVNYMDGMTWQEWYNYFIHGQKDDYEIMNNNMFYLGKQIVLNGIPVLTTDKIKSNQETSYDYVVVQCFVAGIKVLTIDGLINIEDIKVGDNVYSYNENTKEFEYNKVTLTHKNLVVKDKAIVTINGKNIISTSKHNYYTQNRGWIEAKNLTKDDLLLDSNGNTMNIDRILLEKSNEAYYVYNLTIENNHNYFVGYDSALVHNAGAPTC